MEVIILDIHYNLKLAWLGEGTTFLSVNIHKLDL